MIPTRAGLRARTVLSHHHHHRQHQHHRHRQLLQHHPYPRHHSQKRRFSPSATANMPSYIVTCNDDATPEQIAAAKKHAVDQGGRIGHEYSLIKGFSVEFDKDSITTLESHEHVKAVERDGVMTTQ
ncbi:hypothetical protein TOPH_05036 [Tolypocladium ophioglossoides CBS 100239]|uniref:Inhibitor I9 domain-containing protein n=1 Tax=Tolypocladium ophioglossoides (strain CBS 100239) TaxID=1163406 RepID=A0A0L0N997_TOLOC|nr:hypothetical protein TOPH_05036 [Tolypocladium ophioglossoides CBS 100239]